MLLNLPFIILGFALCSCQWASDYLNDEPALIDSNISAIEFTEDFELIYFRAFTPWSSDYQYFLQDGKNVKFTELDEERPHCAFVTEVRLESGAIFPKGSVLSLESVRDYNYYDPAGLVITSESPFERILCWSKFKAREFDRYPSILRMKESFGPERIKLFF